MERYHLRFLSCFRAAKHRMLQRHLTRFIKDDFSDTDDNRLLCNAVSVSVPDIHNVSM